MAKFGKNITRIESCPEYYNGLFEAKKVKNILCLCIFVTLADVAFIMGSWVE
jgi:hypothetical protein